MNRPNSVVSLKITIVSVPSSYFCERGTIVIRPEHEELSAIIDAAIAIRIQHQKPVIAR